MRWTALYRCIASAAMRRRTAADRSVGRWLGGSVLVLALAVPAGAASQDALAIDTSCLSRADGGQNQVRVRALVDGTFVGDSFDGWQFNADVVAVISADRSTASFLGITIDLVSAPLLLEGSFDLGLCVDGRYESEASIAQSETASALENESRDAGHGAGRLSDSQRRRSAIAAGVLCVD